MAPQSARRDRITSAFHSASEHAWVMWIRFANSHTGQRHRAAQTGRTDGSIRLGAAITRGPKRERRTAEFRLHSIMKGYSPHFGPSLNSVIATGSPQTSTDGPPRSFQWNRFTCHPPGIIREWSMMPSAPLARAASAMRQERGSSPAASAARQGASDISRSTPMARQASSSC